LNLLVSVIKFNIGVAMIFAALFLPEKLMTLKKIIILNIQAILGPRKLTIRAARTPPPLNTKFLQI